ncbi:MAG: cysteine hydrolase family protein [Candidatus Limivicinus sp.]|jgi:nicotinamidase/pyrazinamidase
MQNVLVVVDMQNDFIDGVLGTPEAAAIVPKVEEKVKNFDGRVLFTQDTHFENYLNTQEGKKLSVPHCIKGTRGWEIRPELAALCREKPIEKSTFGSTTLAEQLRSMNAHDPIITITFVGLCTDICVISNAIIAKALLPDVPVIVDASCCAGATPAGHKTAIQAMKNCQIEITNE